MMIPSLLTWLEDEALADLAKQQRYSTENKPVFFKDDAKPI